MNIYTKVRMNKNINDKYDKYEIIIIKKKVLINKKKI